MELDISGGARYVLSVLENAGYSAYVVGGAVRDLLLGKQPRDYDIATSALPWQTKMLFKRTIDTGLKHGTVTVVENKECYEVTTYRSETGYADGRHPDAVKYVDNINEDLKRRDFTINAMAYSPKSGLIDLFGGQDDINKKAVRCVGEADRRFKEDSLRMMRGVRFAAQLGFELDDQAKKAARRCAVLIKRISAERILEESNKILLSPNPGKFRLLHELGVLQYIMPCVDNCFGVPQRNKYHIYDVGEHIMRAVENTEAEIVLRWSALMHDIGKPLCLSTDANGIIHFYGHHKESVKLASELLFKLRMDRNNAEDILTLVEYHDVRVDPSMQAVKRMMSRTGETLFAKLIDLQEADNRAKNEKYLSEKLERLEHTRQIYRKILAEGQPYMVSQLAINGRDLLKNGYRAGREIGDTLRTLLEEVIINPELNRREYLIKRARELKCKK